MFLPGDAQTFGLCVLPAFTGAPDPFFGIDSALSWLTGSEQNADLIANLKRCGIGISRERLRWSEIAPSAERVNLLNEILRRA